MACSAETEGENHPYSEHPNGHAKIQWTFLRARCPFCHLIKALKAGNNE